MKIFYATGNVDFVKAPMTRRIALLASAAHPAAFDNKPGWKMDGDKIALDATGNPIYVNAAGQEMSVGGDTISRLNNEAKTNRERAETAEGALNKYKGADGKMIDPEAATKAIGIVAKLDAKQLIDAGEVDRVRETIKGEYAAQLKEATDGIASRDTRINDMLIDGVFANSEFVRDRLAMPRDFFQDAMRRNFKVEDGKPVAYGKDGNKIMSKKHIGEYASPDEALEILVDMHPQKDTILKAQQAGGSGNGGGGGNRGGPGRTMRRSEFDGLDPVNKATAAAEMAKNELTVVD